MKTYYKPTQMRGKRVIYASIDPAELKRRTFVRRVVFASIVLGFGLFVWLNLRGL